MLQLYIIVFALGMFHGINPGMGWLFATTLGLQQHSRLAIVKALIALTIGHAMAIIMVLSIVIILQWELSLVWIKVAVTIALVSVGGYALFRSYHPTRFGLRIGNLGVAMWSFSMATAHGAGLMLVPFIFKYSFCTVQSHQHHFFFMQYLPVVDFSHPWLVLMTISAIHMSGYLLVASCISFIIYEKLGLAILRKGWINFDLLWAITLLVAAMFLWL